MADARQLIDQLVHDLPEALIRAALAEAALSLPLEEVFHFHCDCDSGHVHTDESFGALSEDEQRHLLEALAPAWFHHVAPTRAQYEIMAETLAEQGIHLEKDIGSFCGTHGLHLSHDLEHLSTDQLIARLSAATEARKNLEYRALTISAQHEHTHHNHAHHEDTPLPATPLHEYLKRLESLFPDHGNMGLPQHGWLRSFRDASPKNRAIFEALFEGPDGHLHYRHRYGGQQPSQEQVQTVLAYYEQQLAKGLSEGKPFSDGIVASLLGQVSPHLKLLGHQYDDMIRALEYALTGKEQIMFHSLGDDAARAHQMEMRTGLHIHTGKPIPEVGTVLAMALATAYLADGTGNPLPWAAQTALKAAGVWPFFNHIVRGELEHALAHLKEGTHLQDTVKQMLVTSLILIGTLKKDGTHEIAAGTVMASILASIGHIQTDAAERSLLALQEVLDSLPHAVEEVHGDHTHRRKLDDITPGETLIELKKGDTLPVDVTITALFSENGPSGAPSVLADTYRSRGQMAQRFTIGDRLDQGSVILEDVTLHGRVAASFKQSAIAKQVEEQKTYKPSERQSFAKRVGDNWVWGTVGGTILVTLANILRPLAKGIGIDLNHVLERATSFATLSSPCNILVSTMIEGATTRGLVKEGLIPLRGDAITIADQVTAYALDFTGTCSMGAEFAGVQFFDEQGQALSEEESKTLFAQATAVGMKAGSQHIKQKAMRRALFEQLTPEQAQSMAVEAADAVEDLGQGVRGTLNGHPFRIGKAEYAGMDGALTGNTGEHSLTYIRAGDKIGVVRFTDRLRDGAAEAIAAMGAKNVYILTGDNNREFILNHTRQLGIPDENVLNDLSPEAKAEAIAGLQAKGEKVAMIGDGLNDAAPLRQADVRYAMLDTAHDGILNTVDFLTPNLASIAPIKGISQQVNRISFATLAFSILYTGFTALAEATGIIKLPVIGAAIGHEGVSGAIALLHNRFSQKLVDEFAQERDRCYKPLASGI
jgi:cation transport ATPase